MLNFLGGYRSVQPKETGEEIRKYQLNAMGQVFMPGPWYAACPKLRQLCE